MHHLILVTLSLNNRGNSEEARDSAYSHLMDDDSFCGEGGRFGSPLCEWFVLGGRWSGLLSQNLDRRSLSRCSPGGIPRIRQGALPGRASKTPQGRPGQALAPVGWHWCQ